MLGITLKMRDRAKNLGVPTTLAIVYQPLTQKTESQTQYRYWTYK